jgi:hypothetical protein
VTPSQLGLQSSHFGLGSPPGFGFAPPGFGLAFGPFGLAPPGFRLAFGPFDSRQ